MTPCAQSEKVGHEAHKAMLEALEVTLGNIMSLGQAGALAPCPFCGAVPGLFMNLVLQLTFWRSGWHITCTRCGAEGPKRVTRDRARASWNLRA